MRQAFTALAFLVSSFAFCASAQAADDFEFVSPHGPRVYQAIMCDSLANAESLLAAWDVSPEDMVKRIAELAPSSQRSQMGCGITRSRSYFVVNEKRYPPRTDIRQQLWNISIFEIRQNQKTFYLLQVQQAYPISLAL